jgi:hypothetical protein
MRLGIQPAGDAVFNWNIVDFPRISGESLEQGGGPIWRYADGIFASASFQSFSPSGGRIWSKRTAASFAMCCNLTA